MRKLISTMMTGVFLTGIGIGLAGCSDETAEKSQVTTSTPGGKTTQTTETSVKTSGDNPPAPTKTP